MSDNLLFVLLFLVLVLGSMAGFGLGQEHTRGEAIKAGVARWVVDETTGDVSFVFISKENP